MSPKHNDQLEQLVDSEYQLLHRDLQLVSLEAGQNLFTPGSPFEYVYFPLNALIAIANQMTDGQSMDMAIVGPEGSVGLIGLFKSKCPYRVYVANSGLAYKIAMPKVRQYFDVAGSWVHKLYVQANHRILEQIATETTCANYHSVKARAARWLLTRSQHVGKTILEVTHQSIADSLGVRREGITNALASLPGINCLRNRIEVADRFALEQECCDCYHAIDETRSGQKTLPFKNN